MVLVEGPNGGGKTTLVRHLAQKHGLQIADMKRELHRPPDTSPEGQRERVYTFLARALEGHSPVKIVDRLYFSELVYGKHWRYEVTFGWREQQMIEGVLNAMLIPVIFCIPPLETCRKNVEAQHKEQHPKVLPTLDALWVEYDALQAGREWITRYDYTRGERELDYVDIIVGHYLRFKKERSW